MENFSFDTFIVEDLGHYPVKKVWVCDAVFSSELLPLSIKDVKAKLKLNNGDIKRIVDVVCKTDDCYGERSERFTIKGDTLEAIRDKAVLLFSCVYVNLLTTVKHGDLSVSLLNENEYENEMTL